MKTLIDTPAHLPATTLPLPAISTDTAGTLRILSTTQLAAVDQGRAHLRATDGERWGVWGAARSGACTVLTESQKRIALCMALLGSLIFAIAPNRMVVWSLFVITMMYVLASAYKCWMMVRGERATEHGMGAAPDITAIADEDLPIYTVLVPLHREGAILPVLLDRLQKLDYPTEKLEVLLLIESDDAETRAGLDAYALPPHMRPVTVPPGMPKTKPRALNVGLARARGEFIVIYDAEDQPEPDQLRKAVAAFREAPWSVICYQGRLSFYNPRQSILTRLFALDYYVWYDLLLQGLARTGAFVPLGGTSNHFRTALMRRLGGWDPYNVTEDGDLGVRISRAGLAVRMLDSVTWEEAVAKVHPWVRQRSRWVKGYMQTYLVHMRDPRTLWRELGPSGFLDFQTLLGGSCLILLVNPLMWLLTLAYIVGHGTIVDTAIQSLFPPAIYYPSLLCLIAGNFIFFYTNIYACVRAGYYDLTRYMVLGPLYWVLMSVAAWVALVSLIRNPFYWAKTTHGTSLGSGGAMPSLAVAVSAGAHTAPVAIHQPSTTGVMSSREVRRSEPRLPEPGVVANLDGRFWASVAAGCEALAHGDVWVAMLRLRSLYQDVVLPMRMSMGSTGQTPEALAHVLEATHEDATAEQVWGAYEMLIGHYRTLRAELDLPRTEDHRAELRATALLDRRPTLLDGGQIASTQSLSIVLPAYNEEEVIEETIQTCLAAAERFCPNVEVIVVDDGSRDGTGAIVDRVAWDDARVVAVHHNPNRGYGAALVTGFNAARGHFSFFMDSDGQFDINEIANLLELEAAHPGSVVLGYRAHRSDPLPRRLNAWSWKQLVWATLGVHGIRDIDCAFKLFPTELVRACGIVARGATINTEMLAKLRRMRAPMLQVAVSHYPRVYGKATGANLRVILRAFKELYFLRLHMNGWHAPRHEQQNTASDTRAA